ncbi:MAG: phosphoglucosamine mutase [Euryarchaeota archaeon]|nr:phosphoglucosamine mutase [Euryarchaeota archaeon]
MARRLFGTNGVRGVVNSEMNVQFAMDLGKAIGTFMNGRVAIGNDSRTSADMLKSAVSGGLMSAGGDVMDLGLVPTPALQYFVKSYEDVVGGVMITASHNPPEFNGIKCIDADGTEMARTNEEKIEEIYFNRSFGAKAWNEVGAMRPVSGAESHYLGSIVRNVDSEAIEDGGLSAVLDCANGSGSATSPRLLESLGVRAVTVNCNPLGTFPGHPSEPTEDHLGDLMSMVRSSSADLGIAHDGDADRTIFIDDRGRYVHGDKSLAIIARSIVREKGGGTVVTPVSTSLCVEEVVRRAGGTVVYTMVGAPIVARRMKELGAVFGGEENGGLIFPEHQYCRDGGMATAKMLEVVAKEGRLSSLLETIPDYFLEKRKLRCPEADKPRVLRETLEFYKDERVDLTDGVKVFFDEGWVLIRPSGTEPIFRIMSEGRTERRAREYAEECERRLRKSLRAD